MGAPIAISWQQNIQSVDYLVVPAGSRNREAAMLLIDTMTDPVNQAKLANKIACAPTNPAAFKSIEKAVEPWLSTAPANLQQGFVINAAYWRDNLKKLEARWAMWKLA
jgi:putative spermidine/putrescine transport system substrate-binding protein